MDQNDEDEDRNGVGHAASLVDHRSETPIHALLVQGLQELLQYPHRNADG